MYNSIDILYIKINKDREGDTNGAIKGLDIRDFRSDIKGGFDEAAAIVRVKRYRELETTIIITTIIINDIVNG